MPIFAPKKVVLNWHQHDVSFSTVLMESFVDGIEKQAEESITNYEKRKQIEVVENHPEENYARVVHQGLDDETYHLPTIFLEYFPSLQRRSALLTVCSYFEHELDKLCRLYQSEKGFSVTVDDLRGEGIDRSTKYLEKVAGLNVHRASREWQEVKKIQKIRNAIVHRGGKVPDKDSVRDDADKAIVDFMNKTESLSRDDDGEIVVGKGFLSHVIHTYASYFKLIGDSINASEKQGV
ncbi:MAG: hypothetical protein ACLP0H_14945 [Terriglobales bacterium]